MIRHNIFYLLACIFLFSPAAVKAIESETDREKIVSPRSKKFYVNDILRQRLTVGGSRASDYNSKDYKLTVGYFYQSHNFINELFFLNKNHYADSGSGSKKVFRVKKSELYDLTLSSKMRLLNSENYGIIFHRTSYDDLSEYYYDMRTALGMGRMFLNDKVELDASVGYRDVKNYGYRVDFVPSFRVKLKLSDKIGLTQRGYWFIDHESFDNELSTSITYAIDPRVSFEVKYSFEQRRYEDDSPKKRQVINYVSRSVVLGLIFNL